MAKRIPEKFINGIGIIGCIAVGTLAAYMFCLHFTAPKWKCDKQLTYTLTFDSHSQPKYNSTETKTVCTHYSEQ